MKTVSGLAIVLCLSLMGPGFSAGNHQDGRAAQILGMEKAEIDAEIRKAMPLPVVRILSWKEIGVRKWVVEMSTAPLVAPRDPLIHVRFETRDEAGKIEMMQAFAYAGEHAKNIAVLAVAKD